MVECMCYPLVRIDTILTADSVEWCPTPGLEEILGCGTYQLNSHKNVRLGSLMLFSWDGTKLIQILEKETSCISCGILDMKWKCVEETSILSTANSSGTVSFFKLKQAENELTFKVLGDIKLANDALNDSLHICLSLDWDKVTSSVVASDSLGRVGVVELCEAELRLNHLWKAHEYETWIVCFGERSNIVFSGGDDCVLCQWDLRMGTSKPCFTNRRHSMGVCSLQLNPNQQNILGSGSYDEKLMLWDIRDMSRPLKEKSLGGGIWRIKWNPCSSNLTAAACMHNHFYVVDCHTESSESIEILATYKEHGSLAYGIDWCRKSDVTNGLEEEKNIFTLASCSFYDHSMQLWNISI